MPHLTYKVKKPMWQVLLCMECCRDGCLKPVQCEHVPVACGAQRRFPSQCGKLKMSTSFSLLHDIAGSHGLQISQFSYRVSGPGLVLSEIIAVSTHGLDTMPPAPEGNGLAEDDFDMDEMQVADEGLCVIGLAHRKLRKPAELGGNQLANWLGNPASCMSVAWGNWWR